jgi:hypothetical protein
MFKTDTLRNRKKNKLFKYIVVSISRTKIKKLFKVFMSEESENINVFIFNLIIFSMMSFCLFSVILSK